MGHIVSGYGVRGVF